MYEAMRYIEAKTRPAKKTNKKKTRAKLTV